MWRKIKYSLIFVVLLLSACQTNEKQGIEVKESKIEIEPSDGTKSEIIRMSNILHPKMALTFNGLGSEDQMHKILAELKKQHIKATFFLEGMRVAQEPNLVKEIIAQGHEIQSATLTFRDMSDLNYDQTYEEILLANEIFEQHVGIKPSYIRSRSGDTTENMQLAAATLGMKGIVSYSINPQDRKMQGSEEITAYIKRFSSSGAIIHLNTYINPAIIEAIPLIAQQAADDGFQLTTVSDLLENQYTKLKLEEIKGYDSVQMNLDYDNVTPPFFYRYSTNKKEVALTFDDWAGEERTKEILEILKHYDIKSTFFLIGSGVEKDPHIAKMILEEGHEVANHTYAHQNITEMTPAQLQEDIVKSHRVLTYALQQPPLLYVRPAQGIVDEETAKIIAATGIKAIAMYDIASFDWKTDYTAQDILERIMTRVAPGKIIVMHALDGTKTVEALPLVIEELQRQGYTFEKMSTWIEEYQ